MLLARGEEFRRVLVIGTRVAFSASMVNLLPGFAFYKEFPADSDDGDEQLCAQDRLVIQCESLHWLEAPDGAIRVPHFGRN
jgi:hypothetical protein